VFPAPWHTLSPAELTGEFRTDPEAGLTEEEARRRLAVHGPNELPQPPHPSAFTLFLSQFKNLIIWVLIGAAIVSGLLQEWVDAGAILAIVLLNALLGFAQEFKAERSLAALKQLSIATARVRRENNVRLLAARELVPGDLVLVEAGDHVPADARILYATGVRTQEATLTGESTPVDKAAEIPAEKAAGIADQTNMLFLGTDVTAGKARALVVATGRGTELGRIAALLEKSEPEATPLQRRLEHFGHVLLYLSVGIVSVVFLLGLLRGEPIVDMFLTAVSLAVAAIPEGLPAIVTITLALGVHRMVARHALIRRLPAVETLGSATVICTDKTGTLTKGEMTVTRLFADGCTFDVTGEGYAPVGEIRKSTPVIRHSPEPRTSNVELLFPDPSPAARHPSGVRALLEAAVLCNGATLHQENGVWKVLGDPTEGALLVAAAKLSLWKTPLESVRPFLGEISFDPDRKLMTVVRTTADGVVAYVKGAPDVLLPRCTHYLTLDGRTDPLDDAITLNVRAANSGFAQEALRVLGVARRTMPAPPAQFQAADIEQDLVFLGLAAMRDPLRPEATTAVRACREAGIRTVMITGDHKDTAAAIAKELGILNGFESVSGIELDRVAETELVDRVERIAVYARVSAAHKLRIVKAWKNRGAIVAMTGDGVNDAPAVKAADIGVAMGLTGTDVTKEAADMVVTDDNFASIAAAVETGRNIYHNIIKSVHYLLACNLSEVLVMLQAALFGLPLPLLPVQILWINLVTDSLPALALAVDPSDPDSMRRPPRHPSEQFLEQDRIILMFAQGLFMALIAGGAFTYCLYASDQNLPLARTVTFTVLVMSQLFFVFACRSDRYSLFTIGIWSNKPLVWATTGSVALQTVILLHPWTQQVFKVAPLPVTYWLLAAGLGLLPLLAMELWKMTIRWPRI